MTNETETVWVDVPEGVDAVFTKDGRVFYNMAALVEQFEPRVKDRAFAASITRDPADLAYSEAETALLDAITASRTALLLEVWL